MAGAGAGAGGRWPAKRADAALAQRSAPEAFDVDAARKIFTQMVDAERPPSQRMTGS